MIIWALTGACLAAVVLSCRRHAWNTEPFEPLPGAAWTILMVLPLALEQDGLSAGTLPVHAFGVLLFAAALLAGDWPLVPPAPSRAARARRRPAAWPGYALLAGVVAIQLSHLLLMPKIPLVEKLFGPPRTPIELQALREASSKLLHVPLAYIYLCQTSLTVFAPLAILLLLESGRRMAAALLGLFAFLYAASTLARTPMYAFAMLGALTLYLRLARTRQRVILAAAGASLLIAALAVSAYELASPWSALRLRAPADRVAATVARWRRDLPGMPVMFTLADHNRVMYQDYIAQRPPLPARFVNSLVYRVFLAPIEVSHFWYIYYPGIAEAHLGWEGLTPASRAAPGFIHPANRLGRWAYMGRYPQYYRDSAHAYASADADAQARWGIPGLLAIALALFGLRLGLKYLRVGGVLGAYLNASCLVLLAVTLPNGSLQAILVSHGLWLPLGLIALRRWSCRSRARG